ncbi:hypothetical protein LJR164_001485 [Phenylobacterium sp. LjRoot164]|uniref:hypothetical protein n=1 Tax=unclassified Phenylobacterium TaxID=2640670 RepID=UPI003ECDB6F9
MTISSADASNDRGLSGSVFLGDGAAIATTALGLGIAVSKGISPIVAGAVPLMLLFVCLIVAWPAATIARARGHHGPLAAMAWGAGLAAPLALGALATGSLAAAGAVLGFGLVGALLVWALVKAQRASMRLLPERYRRVGSYAVAGLLLLGALVVLAQWLLPRGSSESSRVVAVVEVPLRSATDRADLLAMLHAHAREEGQHVDDGSEEWGAFQQTLESKDHEASSPLNKTIYASVWRDRDDKDQEVSVDDGGHQGRPWLMFFRGERPDLATGARLRLQAKIRARWPDAREVPVMPSGSLPSADDLVWTGEAYAVKPERAAAYAEPEE